MTSFKEKNSKIIEEKILEFSKKYSYLNFRPYFLIAIYQNVTLLYKNIHNIKLQVFDIFQPIVDKYFQNYHENSLVVPLLENSFVHNLKIDSANWNHIELNLLLMQIKFSILFSNCSLITSLRDLFINTNTIKEKYLPTMPQDNVN